MNYSENPGMVRFDRFKDTGKWYDTYAVDMTDYWGSLTPVDGLLLALRNDSRFGAEWVQSWLQQGGSIVCLEPFHRYAYPVQLKDYSL